MLVIGIDDAQNTWKFSIIKNSGRLSQTVKYLHNGPFSVDPCRGNGLRQRFRHFFISARSIPLNRYVFSPTTFVAGCLFDCQYGHENMIPLTGVFLLPPGETREKQ